MSEQQIEDDNELDENQYAQLFLSQFPNIDQFYTYMQVPQIIEHLHKVQIAERLISQKIAQILGTLIQDNARLKNTANQEEYEEPSSEEDKNLIENIRITKNTHKISQMLKEKISRKKVKYDSQNQSQKDSDQTF